MPPLEMRGRYLMREYWADTDLFTRTTAEVRELYKGLWMLADDDGWMPRDVPGIGAALYRFLPPDDRNGLVRSGIDRLKALGKVVTHRCGCLFLPSVARYPRAGRKSAVHHLNHQSHSSRFETHASTTFKGDLNPSPVPTRPYPTRRRADAREGTAQSAKERLAAAARGEES